GSARTPSAASTSASTTARSPSAGRSGRATSSPSFRARAPSSGFRRSSVRTAVIPLVRPFARGLVPVATGEEATAYDRRAVDELGVPEPTLMESAGRAAAEVVQRLFPTGEVVGVVGSGNNGGDGLVALRTLAAWGRSVRAVAAGDRPDPDPLLRGWEVPTIRD